MILYDSKGQSSESPRTPITVIEVDVLRGLSSVHICTSRTTMASIYGVPMQGILSDYVSIPYSSKSADRVQERKSDCALDLFT